MTGILRIIFKLKNMKHTTTSLKVSGFNIKIFGKLSAVFICCLILCQNLFAQYVPGNLMVLRVGDGSSALSSAATSVSLLEFSTSGSLITTTNIPTSGANTLTVAGTSTSEGLITRSADGKYIVLAGYNAAPGTAGIAGTTAASVARVVDTVNSSGAIGRAITNSNQFSGANFRSATSSGNNFWGAGSNSGTYYLGTGTPGTVQATPANTRMISVINNTLYFSTGSAPAGIHAFTGTPTTGSTSTAIATLTSPYGFAINPAGTIMYVADDGTGVGIKKYTNSGGGWTLAYTVCTTACRGLAVDFSGANPILYATSTATSANTIYKVTDSGIASAPYTALTLATAPSNTVFRGLAFAPTCVSPTLSTNITNVTCNGGNDGAVALTVTGGSAPFTFDWKNSLNVQVGTTQNMSGLTADTYIVTVTGGGCSASISAVVTEPAVVTVPVQDNSISFSAVTQNSITLSLTSGGGAGRVIKINTSNSFTAPVDGTLPVANTVYSGSGEQTIYNSTSASVTVSGLIPGTQYYFAVYAYNGAGACRLYNSTPATADQLTQTAASPVINIAASLSAFSTVAGVPSASQSYSVSGSSLNDDILITAPASYELSLNNSLWVTSQLLTQSGGSVPPTTIYIRLNPVTGGSFAGNISHVSTGASTQDVAVSGTALETEPSSQSALTFSNITSSTIDVTMAGGNGSGRILVVSAGTPSYTPSDGVSSTGVNSNFSLATDQGSGTKIVFDASGTTVTVTGLNSATLYTFNVFEYNGSATTINYNTVAPGTGTSVTTTAEPTITSTMTFTRIRIDSAFATLAGGNGSSRLIVMSTSPVTFAPVDGNSYSGASTDFALAQDLGSGNKLVFNASPSSSLSLSGLTRGTTYYLAIYEYNGSSTTTNYLTSSSGNGLFTTPDYILYSGGTYSQDFNSLPISGLSSSATTGFGVGPYFLITPPVNASLANGWQYAKLSPLTGNVPFITDNGGSNSGAIFSYGSSASSDRALGSLGSSSVASAAVGAVLINSGSTALNTVNITFNGEQWRAGGSANINKLIFEYQLGGSDIATGTFTAVNALDFSSPVSSAAAALDGNLAAYRTAVSGTFFLTGNWLPGQTLAIRWRDADDSGADDGLSIDDVTFDATSPQSPTVQDANIVFTNTFATTTDISWTNGDGSDHIVVINTTNTFTAPVDGNSYSGNSSYAGGEQIIYNGIGNSVSVTGLSPSTTYFVRVYGYNGSGGSTIYNTSTASGNPASFTTQAPVSATQLYVLNVNGGMDVNVNLPFSITVQSRDVNNQPSNVSVNTTISVNVFSGTGVLSGTVSGVITAGTSQVTISGLTYDTEESGVVLEAFVTAGTAMTSAQSQLFNVLGNATQLIFSGFPTNGVNNTPVSAFNVFALRDDFSIDNNYNGLVTLSQLTGPGVVSGTLSQIMINGVATFTDIQFSLNGTYSLEASASGLSSATSTSLLINGLPALVELVVPKYIGAKTSSNANDARTPIAICIRIDNITPNSLYNLAVGMARVSESSSVMGAGSIWDGVGFGSMIRNNAFVTDANGSSGPVWIYFQPTGNASRFQADSIHNLRIAYSTSQFGTLSPNFIGTKTIKALDISTSPQTVPTSDDGAFLTASTNVCNGGKFVLIYDNETGTGDPVYCYQAVTASATNTNQSDLPAAINSIFTNSAAAGSYAAVIPVANSNGIRRVESRNADNTIFNFATDADGIWPAGANTVNPVRRTIAALTASDASLSTISSVTTSSGAVTCFGSSDGFVSASATSSTGTVAYNWTPGNLSGDIITGLPQGTYSVFAGDANGCISTGSATISSPAQISISGQVVNSDCAGSNNGSIDLTVSGGTGLYSYSWSNSETTQDISLLAAGTYTITVTDANNCTNTSSFNIVEQSSGSTVIVNSSPSEICAGQSATLSATGALSYVWSPATGLSSTTDSVVVANPATTTAYTVNGTDGTGCLSQTTFTLVVNPLPVVNVTATATTFCEGGQSILTATGATIYNWSPATGLSATSGSAVTASPATTTTYTVTGISTAGCSADALISINVINNPAPSVVTPVTYCQNETATPLSATSASGQELVWYVNASGGTGSLTAPVPSTSLSGTTTFYVSQRPATPPLSIAINGYVDNGTPDLFSVVALSDIPSGTVIYFTDNGWTGTAFRGALTTDANGSEDLCKLTTTGIIPAGTVMLSYTNGSNYSWTSSGAITCTTCGGTNSYGQLSISTTGDQIYAFTNSNSDNPLFNTATQIHLYIFDDTNGFENASTANSGAVTPGLISGVTANSFNLASSNYITLINDSVSRTVSAWRTYMSNVSNYLTGTGTSPSLSTQSISIDFGCESPRIPLTVNVIEAPVVSATSGTIECNGGTTTVAVSASAGTGPYNGEGTFTSTAGTYTYIVTDANNCSGSGTITITEPQPVVVDAGPDINICVDGSVTLSGLIFGAPGGLWTGGAGTFSPDASTLNAEYQPAQSEAGTVITLYLTSTGVPAACAQTDSIQLTIDGPIAANAGSDQTVCSGFPVTMAGTVSGTTGGTWSTSGDGTYNNNLALNAVYTPGPGDISAGQVTLTLSPDQNGSCQATPDSMLLNINATPSINAVTPASGCPGDTVIITGTSLDIVTSVDFTGNSSIFVIINSGEIHAVVPVGASSGVLNVSTSANCSGSSSTTFTINTCSSNTILNLKIFIQGYYTGSGMMEPVLFNEGIAGALSTDVDTVEVSLMHSSTYSLIESFKGMLHTDGTIQCSFSSAIAGSSYYIKINHRNLLETWSASAIAFTPVTTYNFTDNNLKAYQDIFSSETQMIQIESGVWAMYNGDVNQDFTIDGFDFAEVEIDVNDFAFGYYDTDISNAGPIDGFDFAILEQNVSLFLFVARP
jgi:hypothetical protein